MEEFVLSTSDSESPLTRSYSQRLMSDSVRYYLLWPFIFIAFFFYRFTQILYLEILFEFNMLWFEFFYFYLFLYVYLNWFEIL